MIDEVGGTASGATGKPVGAVLAAVQILRFLAAQREPVTNNEIARALGLNMSTSFNILKTLAGEGFAVFDVASKAYLLGPSVVELVSGAIDQIGYLRLINPELEQLTSKWGVTTALWLRISRSEVLLVDRTFSKSLFQVQLPIGRRLSALSGALGRSIGANADFSREEMKALYAKVRADDPLSFEDFLTELEHARSKGYGVDRDRSVRGILSISSAILDHIGKPIFALSVVTLSAQCSTELEMSIGADIRDAVRRIRQMLAGSQIQIDP